jgi:glycosyltransferase Alg8
MVFHLSNQKWANRGNQSAGNGTSLMDKTQNAIAKFQLITTVAVFIVGLAIYIDIIPAPSFF